jgi:hypothetical protein
MTKDTAMITYRCPECGSESCYGSADVSWDPATQQFVYEIENDKPFECLNCDNSTHDWDQWKVEVEPFEPQPTALSLAGKMRQAQKAYFAHRTQENLVAAKQAEKAFDDFWQAGL